MREWGTQGSSDGQFDTPFAIAVNSDEVVYVTETGNRRVQVFDANGEFVGKWGTPGTGDGQFLAPVGIGVGPSAKST